LRDNVKVSWHDPAREGFPSTEHSKLTGLARCGSRQLVFDVPAGNPSRRLKRFLDVDPFYLILSRWIDQEHVFPHFARRHWGIQVNFEGDASEKSESSNPCLDGGTDIRRRIYVYGVI
jgi:hypothetical protein